MTMTDQYTADLEARIAALEARFGTAQPLAAPPVTVGDLTNVPQPLAPITSQWTQQATARTIGRYATPTARANAWAASVQPLAKGTGSYLSAGDATEGPEWYNGTAWRKPWNMPWGMRATAIKSATEGGFDTTIRDISGLSLSVPVVANRQYRLTLVVLVTLTVATSYGQFYITDGSNSQFAMGAVSPGGVAGSLTVTGLYVPVTAPTVTFKARCNCGSGNLSVNATTTQCFLTVEDVGPNTTGAPT